MELFQVVHALNNARALQTDESALSISVPSSAVKTSSAFPGPGTIISDGLVDVAVGVTGQSNRFLPVFHAGLDAFYHDRSTEHGAVHNRTDRTVGTLPHFFQVDTLSPGLHWG